VKLKLKDGAAVTGRIVVVRLDAIVLENIQTGSSGVRTAPGARLGDGLTLQRTDVASIEMLFVPRGVSGPRAGSFEQLSVLVGTGEKVAVTTTAGTRLSGTIARLSPSTLSVRVGQTLHDLRESDVATVRQRRNDSLANGAKWGLGAGAAVGMIACGRCHLGPGLAMAAVYGGIGAGIGVGLDALTRSNVVIYQSRTSARRVTIAPQLAKSHKGLTVSVGF
jgi:hypothetical protein